MSNKKHFQNWLKKWEKKEEKKIDKIINEYFNPKEKVVYKTTTKEILPERNESDDNAINFIKKIIGKSIEKSEDLVENETNQKLMKKVIKENKDEINNENKDEGNDDKMEKPKQNKNFKIKKNVDECKLFDKDWNEVILNENYSKLIVQDQEYPNKDSEYGISCGKVNMIKGMEDYQKFFLKNFIENLKNPNKIFGGMIVVHECENTANELILPALQCLFDNDEDKIIILTSYSGILTMKEKFNKILIENDLKQFQKRIEWYSYEIFYSTKKKLPSFENSILILGDAHRLRKELLERGKKKSEYLKNILESIEKAKFILACTETPFFKSFWDWISLYEIIYKPKNKQLPKDFTQWLEQEKDFIVGEFVLDMENNYDKFNDANYIYESNEKSFNDWMGKWKDISELEGTISIYFNSYDNGMFPNIDKNVHYINYENGDEKYVSWFEDWNHKILNQINNDSNLSLNSSIELSHICNSLVIKKSNNNDQTNNDYYHKHSLKIESAKKVLQEIIEFNNDIEKQINDNFNDKIKISESRALNIKRVLIYVRCDDAISCIINLLPYDKFIIMNQTNDTLKIDFQFLEYYKTGLKPYMILKNPPQEPSIFPLINHILFMTQPLTPGEEERIISMAKRKYSFQMTLEQNLYVDYFYLSKFKNNNNDEIFIENSTIDLKSKSLLKRRHILSQISTKLINLHSIQRQQLSY